MEASEINEFSKGMQEAGEQSMTHVSLIISVLAVLVAMVTVLGHREHTEAVLMQTRAGDQWNEYQARKMRVQQITTATDLLSLQPSSDTAGVQAKLHSYESQRAHWEEENNDAAEKAKDFEGEVDRAERKAARYDLGEALLQIAVVLASITLLTRQRRYVIAALALGAGGLVVVCIGLLLP